MDKLGNLKKSEIQVGGGGGGRYIIGTYHLSQTEDNFPYAQLYEELLFDSDEFIVKFFGPTLPDSY